MHTHELLLTAECDDEAAALYLPILPGRVARTVRVSDHVLVDLSDDGRLLGIELLGPARVAMLGLPALEEGP